jgi:hypothetical protein
MCSRSPRAVGAGLGARPAPLRRRGNLLGSHNAREGDDDVGLPGADGARTAVARYQVPQCVSEAAFNPVPHHHPGSGRCG